MTKLYVHHRVSIDADYLLRDLKKNFAKILKKVEQEAGWVTKRIEALESLDRLYPQLDGTILLTQQLAIQLAEPKPWDLSQTNLMSYKSLKKPYANWNEIKKRARAAGQKIILQKLSD